MTCVGRRTAAAAFAAAALLLTGGCGGQPTVVPAGSAGLGVPPDPPGSAPDAGAAGAPSAQAAPAPTPRTTKPASDAAGSGSAGSGSAGSGAAGSGAGRKAGSGSEKKAGSGTGAAKGSAGAAGTPSGSGTKATTTGDPGTEARPAALPPLGTFSYAMTGTSSLGPPPSTSTITVADAGPGTQLWTLDSRRQDGAGLIEELTLRRSDAGVHLSAYRLDASTGIAGVILEFKPASPVLLTPTAGKAGTTWPFDLGTSTDGCATAKGTGELLDPGAATSLRRFRLTTTVHTVGPASCIAVEGERTQEIRHPANSLLPTQIDSDLRGKVAGVAFRATTKATRPPGTTGGVTQAPHKAALVGRARPVSELASEPCALNGGPARTLNQIGAAVAVTP